MDKFENIVGAANMAKLNELLKRQDKKELQEEKKCNITCILAIIGAVVVIALAIYGLYKYLKPDYMDDFDDDFEDDFEDDFFEEDDE